jgi:hypothetical protein
MAEIEQALEESNRSKYGAKEFDLISEQYRNSEHDGHVWSGTNAVKYINRYKREGSSKSGNLSDLLKAQDYLNRMIDAHKKFHPEDKELKEFK